MRIAPPCLEFPTIGPLGAAQHGDCLLDLPEFRPPVERADDPSTTSSINPLSSPSPLTRITGSVPEGRTTTIFIPEIKEMQ
jgi:hypothetical protein